MLDQRQRSWSWRHRMQTGPICRIEILLRIGLESLRAALAAEVVRAAFMVDSTGRLGRVDLHAAHDISFHVQVPLVGRTSGERITLSSIL